MRHTTSLKAIWKAFQKANPHLSLQEAATQLGVSEAELLATHSGENCTCLRPEFKALLPELRQLAEVTTTTENSVLIHELNGSFGKCHFDEDHAWFCQSNLHNCYQLANWKYVYVVYEQHRPALQFFNQYGQAVHKISPTNDRNMAAWYELITIYRTPQQRQHIWVEHAPQHSSPQNPIPNPQLLRQAWQQLRNAQAIPSLLQQYGGYHPHIYRALGKEYAHPVDSDVIKNLLYQLANQPIPVKISGMNDGAAQVFDGKLHTLIQTGAWLQVMGHKFKLQLRNEALGEVWYTRYLSKQGWQYSVSALDQQGQEVLAITPSCKHNSAQATRWTQTLQQLINPA